MLDLKKCGSPIEKTFCKILLFFEKGLIEHGFDPQQQYKIPHNKGFFRVDFALIHPNGKIVIELDGHQWHEKTKNQASGDKARDRFLVAEGWRVLRFTGSNVFHNPCKCVAEVFDIIERMRLARFSPEFLATWVHVTYDSEHTLKTVASSDF
jgi:very-short-patch-repair endonuclease